MIPLFDDSKFSSSRDLATIDCNTRQAANIFLAYFIFMLTKGRRDYRSQHNRDLPVR